MLALEILFWVFVALIVWTQLGYAAALAVPRPRAARRGVGATRTHAAEPGGRSPCKSLLDPGIAPGPVADRGRARRAVVIAAKVANALALDYPRERLQVIVACDGCTDATAARARDAGADLVLELARGGKIRAQDAAVERASGEIVAFSDANALWEPDAARVLVAAFEDPRVGYACGQVRFVQAAPPARRQPGGRVLALRAGGARARVPPVLDHRRQRRDLRDPPRLLHRRRPDHGPRPVAAVQHRSSAACAPCTCPHARASEKMVPSLAGEFARKRRMMSHTWPIVLRGGMLSPRGYPPGYALMILSHRLLRYATPALAPACAGRQRRARRAGGAGARSTTSRSRCSSRCCSAPRSRELLPVRPLLIARYYVLTTASLAAGLWDWLRHGTEATWEAAEGTR